MGSAVVEAAAHVRLPPSPSSSGVVPMAPPAPDGENCGPPCIRGVGTCPRAPRARPPPGSADHAGSAGPSWQAAPQRAAGPPRRPADRRRRRPTARPSSGPTATAPAGSIAPPPGRSPRCGSAAPAAGGCACLTGSTPPRPTSSRTTWQRRRRPTAPGPGRRSAGTRPACRAAARSAAAPAVGSGEAYAARGPPGHRAPRGRSLGPSGA